MSATLSCFSLLVLALLAKENQAATDKIICYYKSWSSYENYQPEDFDATLCTHVNYAFVSVDNDGNLKIADQELDINRGLYKRVTDMKQRNGNLKVLLSVGGASSAALFADMAASDTKRAAFVQSASNMLSTYNFDGLDVDWELPNAPDKANFITLLSQLRTEFNNHGWILTAAVSASPGEGYDVPQMNNLLDIINVMSYDMYGPWSSYTGQNSPLYASSVESDWEKNNLNLASAGNNWLNAGASADKIAMGTAFYGRSFTLADPNQHGLHAPITGVGPGDGALNYNNICLNYNDWTRVWDDEQKNPYKYQGNQWFGYDDVDSIAIKVDYIKSKNFAGVMIWAIDADDVHGSCGTKQAMLQTVKAHL